MREVEPYVERSIPTSL